MMQEEIIAQYTTSLCPVAEDSWTAAGAQADIVADMGSEDEL